MRTKNYKNFIIIVLAILPLPLLAQDFMNIFFNDGTFRTFHLDYIKEFSVSQTDANGIQHSNYDFQYIETIHEKFVYELAKIDSISFTKYDPLVSKKNTADAMVELTREISNCVTIDDVNSKLDVINQIKGIETAWIEGGMLKVKIKDSETIDFYWSNELDNSSYNTESFMEEFVPDFSRREVKKNGQKAVIANQQHYDNSSCRIRQRNDFMYPLKEKFIEAGFDATYNPKPDLNFFLNDMYFYDVILLSTHGGYSKTDGHSFVTGEKLGEYPMFCSKDEMNNAMFSIEEKYEELFNDRNYALSRDYLSKGYVHETRIINDVEVKYVVAYVDIKESFFRNIVTRQFSNPKSIFFNCACESLKDGYNLSNIFITERRLGSYLGYTQSNYFGPEAGCTFFTNYLNGESFEDAYKALGHESLDGRGETNNDGSYVRIGGTYKDEHIETINTQGAPIKNYTASLILLPQTTLCPDENHPHIIDLGNGVKWACCNLGASAPWEYGGYYRWSLGSIDEKKIETKGVVESNSNGYVDISGSKYDIVREMLGEPWRLPTPDELDILHISSHEWFTVKGINGRKFTGPNGNSIFLPAAGFLSEEGDTINLGGHGYYWSSVISALGKSSLCFGSGNTMFSANVEDVPFFWDWFSIRPVYDDGTTTVLQLSEESIGMLVDNRETVRIISGSGCYTVKSNDTSVATATIVLKNLEINAKDKGTAIITVTDLYTGQRVTLQVIVNRKLSISLNGYIDLPIGESLDVSIISGNGDYVLKNSNTDIATATLNESTITVKAMSGGYATITVTDTKTGQDAYFTVRVTTDLALSSMEPLELKIGESTTVIITSGNGKYKVSCDNNIATATVSGNSITVTAKSLGITIVTVTDTRTNQTIFFKVIVTADFVLSSTSPISLKVGEETTVSIISGSGNYTAKSVKTDVVKVTLKGTVITVSAIGTGTDDIIVSDKKIGQNDTIKVTVTADLMLSNTMPISLKVGGSAMLTIVSGNGNYTTNSSNTNVAKVTTDGTIITLMAVGAGTATITVKDIQSGQTGRIEVTVTESEELDAYDECPDANHPHMIDLGLSVKWSCCNAGAHAPEQYGGYYAWGETTEKDSYSFKNYLFTTNTYNGNDGWFDNIDRTNYYPVDINVDNNIYGTQYDAARANCGEPWRMPTVEEFKELVKCSSEWAIMNGIKGCKFTGPNGNSIFLPAAGDGWEYGKICQGTMGEYWSGMLQSSDKRMAIALNFGEEYVFVSDSYSKERYKGLTIRPVAK